MSARTATNVPENKLVPENVLPPSDRSAVIGNLVTLAVASVLLVFCATVQVSDTGDPFCLSRRLLHVSCPGCGLTRSVTAFAHLEFARAFRLHAIGPVFVVLTAAVWLLAVAGLVKGHSYLPDLDAPWFAPGGVLLMSTMILYWIVRLVAGILPP
jgi:hypothetical protein